MHWASWSPTNSWELDIHVPKGFYPHPPFNYVISKIRRVFPRILVEVVKFTLKYLHVFSKTFQYFWWKNEKFCSQKTHLQHVCKNLKISTLYKQLEVEPFDMLHSFSDTRFFFSNWQMNALLSKQSPKATTLTLLSMFEVFFLFFHTQWVSITLQRMKFSSISSTQINRNEIGHIWSNWFSP